MSEIDNITELFMQTAVDEGNPDHLVKVIGKLQELLVSMFALYIIMEGKEHQDHDCKFFKALPDAITDFKAQLMRDIDSHVRGNLLVNGITLTKTHNQQVSEAILKALKEAE